MQTMQARMLQQNDIIQVWTSCIIGKPKVNHFVYTNHNNPYVQVFKEKEWVPNSCFTISHPPKQFGLIIHVPKFMEKFKLAIHAYKFAVSYFKRYNEFPSKLSPFKAFLREIKNPNITIHVMFK